MKDGGFDFGGSGRRQPRSFEVPPWEQEAFDKLQQEQPEQTEPPQEEAEATPVDLAALIPEVTPAVTGEEPGTQEPEPVADSETRDEVDHARMTEMLAKLAAEEPSVGKGFWKVAVASSLLLAVIGVTMVVWGTVATAKTRAAGGAGVAGGLLLTAVGAAFAGIAVFVAVKTLRDRGVL